MKTSNGEKTRDKGQKLVNPRRKLVKASECDRTWTKKEQHQAKCPTTIFTTDMLLDTWPFVCIQIHLRHVEQDKLIVTKGVNSPRLCSTWPSCLLSWKPQRVPNHTQTCWGVSYEVVRTWVALSLFGSRRRRGSDVIGCELVCVCFRSAMSSASVSGTKGRRQLCFVLAVLQTLSIQCGRLGFLS